MLYYIIIHTEAELTSLLPGKGAWAHVIISKGGFQGGPRGYLRGVGAPCRGYFGIATPGGDPPNTHTHTRRWRGPAVSKQRRHAVRRAARCGAARCDARTAPIPSPYLEPLHGTTARTRNLRGEPLTALQIRAAQNHPPLPPPRCAALSASLRLRVAAALPAPRIPAGTSSGAATHPPSARRAAG